jgi:hypothetical protein
MHPKVHVRICAGGAGQLASLPRLELIAVIFQYVEALVLDFPPCSGAIDNRGDGGFGYRARGSRSCLRSWPCPCCWWGSRRSSWR